jgi:hypothetical protein
VALVAIVVTLAVPLVLLAADRPTHVVLGGQVTDAQALQPVDFGTGRRLYSNRDAGFSARLAGHDSAGRAVSRDLWVFGDSGGWDTATGAPFTGFFPSNTASLVRPVTGPGSSQLPPMATPVVRDHGEASRFAAFITGGGNPVCPPSRYPASWPTGVLTLPDSGRDDADRYEYALVFFQHMCVSLDPPRFGFWSTGLAVTRWDADRPDDPAEAVVIADELFAPGRWHSYFWDVDDRAVGSAGLGPRIVADPGSGRSSLEMLACGPASDCMALRTAVDPADSAGTLRRLGEAGRWSYRAEGPSAADDDDSWVPLATPDCTATPYLGCGTSPPAKAVLRAGPERLSQVWGAPSVAVVDGRAVMLYQPAPAGRDLEVDHAAIRVADRNGIFGPPVRLALPAAHCGPLTPGRSDRGCYAPVLHPELASGDRMALSYLAKGDQPVRGTPIPIGVLRLGWTCLPVRVRLC